ncbi:MAG TPA: hypothetical protein VIM27_03400 [Gaiellales bacterium]|jgi:uncharacterized lipoprotein YbaY
MRIARRAALVVALAAIVGLIVWHDSSGSPAKPGRAAVVPIAGAVLMDAGSGIPSATSDSSLDPIRSAPVLVRGVTVSGRRLQRRLRADRHGRFRLNLPPGSYMFIAILDQESKSIADQPSTTLAVRVGQTSRPLPVQIIATENVTTIV